MPPDGKIGMDSFGRTDTQRKHGIRARTNTINSGCPPSPQHSFWSTAIRRHIRAALYFCSCELRWRSTVCSTPVLTCWQIFLQLWT